MNCNAFPGSLIMGPLEDRHYYSSLPCGYDVCAYQYAGAGSDGQLLSQNGRIRPNSILARLDLPCQNSSNWNYDECYSYYANGCYNTCQFINIGDIEDFM